MSEQKIAKSACTVCHEIKPRTEMKQVTRTAASGHSIGGNTNRKGISGRQYYKKTKQWVCDDCRAKQKSNSLVTIIFLALVIGGLYLFL
jgi:hypothetical protein